MKNDPILNETNTSLASHANASRPAGAVAPMANTAPLIAGSHAFTTAQDQLILFLENFLATLQIELVTIEIINQREKHLRIFIDSKTGVGIEDCVRVTQALDEPLEQNLEVAPLLDALFKGPYELEVSSPGIERPLRKVSDYERFMTSIARIHTHRALTEQESHAPAYSTKNPKQKNFYGILRGISNDQDGAAVLFGVVPEDGTLKNSASKTKKKLTGKKETALDLSKPLKNETLLHIPLNLIAKANLEVEVEWPEEA